MLRLHSKYGVNPTMPVCFWCGKETGVVALLGAAYREQAPMRMVLDLEPCAACWRERSKGITLIECEPYDPYKKGQPPEISEGHCPTGRWMVITEDAARRFIHPVEMLQKVLDRRAAFLDRETWGHLMPLCGEEDVDTTG